MKITLTKLEAEKLAQALVKEQQLKQDYIAKQQQLHESMKSRQDIFEMICDKHKIDVKKFDGKVQINGNELTLSELPAGKGEVRERIKQASKSRQEKNKAAHTKAQAEKLSAQEKRKSDQEKRSAADRKANAEAKANVGRK